VICVDASLALSLFVPNPQTAQVRLLWGKWEASQDDLVAPPLFFAEVTSVLRQHVYFRRIAVDEGERAFADFMQVGVRSVSPPDLQPRAWGLAKEFGLPRAYDAQYLAVAATLGCDLWTADGRLARAVRVPWVRLVGEETPAT